MGFFPPLIRDIGQKLRYSHILFLFMQLHDKEFDLFIPEQSLQDKMSSMSADINKDYVDKEIHFVAILNGAFMFAADLIKNILVILILLKFDPTKGLNPPVLFPALLD